MTLLWGTLIPSRKGMSLKFTGKLCVMTMKKDAKFEKELTSSKLTWGTQQILTRAFENLKNLLFNGLHLTKIYNASAWKVQRSYVWCHSRLTKKIEGKLICCFRNDKNLKNFDLSTQKSQKFVLWLALYSNAWPKKVERSHLSWY